MVLNRRDFGINYSRQDNPTFVGENITVEIELVTRALDARSLSPRSRRAF
jgi:hypothetical protein